MGVVNSLSSFRIPRGTGIAEGLVLGQRNILSFKLNSPSLVRLPTEVPSLCWSSGVPESLSEFDPVPIDLLPQGNCNPGDGGDHITWYLPGLIFHPLPGHTHWVRCYPIGLTLKLLE